MALTVTANGTGTHNTGAATLVPGGRTATIPVGSVGVLAMALDNAGSQGANKIAVDWTDAKGNVWVWQQDGSGLYDNGAASAGIEMAWWVANITTALLTTDAGTITWNGGSPTAKAWTWYTVTPSAGRTVAIKTGGAIAGATAANAQVTTASVSVGDAVIAGYFSENVSAVTGDSDTTNGTWGTQQTATVGSTTSGVRIATQHKVQTTAASTQSYDVTVSSQDRIAGYIILRDALNVTVSGAAPTGLTLSTFAPTVTITNNVRATIGKLTLTTTRYVPSVSVSVGYVLLDASTEYVDTPDHADFGITGDIDVRVAVRFADYTTDDDRALISQGASVFSDLAWLFHLGAGTTTFTTVDYSPTGGAGRQISSTSNLVYVDGQDYWLRFTIDVDNGASQRAISFYYSTQSPSTDPDSVSWTLIETILVSGVLTLHNSTANVTIGRLADGSFYNTQARVYYAEVRNGIGGTKVANPDFRNGVSGTTLTDNFGKVWTLQGGASYEGPQRSTPPVTTLSLSTFAPVVINRAQPPFVLPESVTQTSGTWSGDYTEIDDDPLGATATADEMNSSSVGAGIVVNFPTPAWTISSTASGLLSRTLVALSAATSGTVAVRDGTTVLATQSIPISAFQQIIQLSFSKSQLSDPTGAGLNVQITSTGGTTPLLRVFATDLRLPVGVGGSTYTPPTTSLILTTFAPVARAPRLATPPVKTLTLSTFAPVVSAPRTATVDLKALVITGLAPVATVSNNTRSTPAVAALTISTFAITARAPRLATPPVKTLTLTTFAPTPVLSKLVTVGLGTLTLSPKVITVSAPRLVVPSVTSLTTTKFVPAIGKGYTVPVRTLTLTTFAPTIRLPKLVTAGLTTISATKFAPTVSTPRLVTVSATSLSATRLTPNILVSVRVPMGLATLTTNRLSPVVSRAVNVGLKTLALTTFAPTVSTPRTVTPGVTSLTTARFSPTVQYGYYFRPNTTAVTTTRYAPSVQAPRLATPNRALVVTLAFTPSVPVSDNKTAIPSVKSLAVSGLAPTVALSDHKVVVPAKTSLVTATYAPNLNGSNNQSVVPVTKSLATSTFASTITVSDRKVTVPAVRSLTLTAFAPNVTATAHKVIVPSVTALTITRLTAAVSRTAHVTATPNTKALALSGKVPSVSNTASVVAVPTTATLTTLRLQPTALMTDNKRPVPPVKSLTITRFAPTVTRTQNVVVTPAKKTLTLTLQSASVTAGNRREIIPLVAVVSTVGYEPRLYTPRRVTPSTRSAAVVGYTVVPSWSDHKNVSVDTLPMALALYRPIVDYFIPTPGSAEPTLSDRVPYAVYGGDIGPYAIVSDDEYTARI